MATTACGTPGYIAPEILNKEPYDGRCDFWSLGVVLYVLLCGNAPFFSQDNFELFRMITDGKYEFKDPVWNKVSDEAKDLITGLLKVNPAERLTA